MGKARRLLSIVGRRGGWVLSIKILLSLVALVFAASISVTTTTYQAEVGSVVNVAAGLLATSISYYQASSAASATTCSSPPTFGSTPGTANTNIASGHWVYDVRVNTTGSPPLNKNFTVTFVLGSTSYGPVCIQTAGSANSLWIIDCKFDIGSTLPFSPYTYKVTIQ